MIESMRRNMNWLRRKDEGQAAFEFLLTLPIFFMFFLLLIDFGITMYGYVSIANATREGARWGAVDCGGSCSAALIQDRVVNRSGGFLTSTGDVSVSWPTGGDRGSSVVVRVSHNHSSIFFAFLPVWTIESCADMRLEQQDPGVTTPSGSGC